MPIGNLDGMRMRLGTAGLKLAVPHGRTNSFY